MNTVQDASGSPREHLARFALAQYLLFDAVVESLSTLGENVAQRRARAAGAGDEDEEFSASELTEPFRARYEYFRRVR
jgi:hypothetical protein